MSKYDALGHFLSRNRQSEIHMTFKRIEELLGFPLPAKAQRIRAWWSNNPQNNVMTRVWLAAGYKTARVDVASGRLVFKRVGSPGSGSPDGGDGKPEAMPRRHPGFGSMKGLTTIAADTDLTAPTAGDWGRS